MPIIWLQPNPAVSDLVMPEIVEEKSCAAQAIRSAETAKEGCATESSLSAFQAGLETAGRHERQSGERVIYL